MDDNALQQLFTLARLAPQEGELERLRGELNGILQFVQGVQSAVATVEKQPQAGQFHTVLRPDERVHEPGTYTEAIAAQFPDREGDYLAVHQVITGGKHIDSH
ncbi:MAG: hypothetical protein RI911_627 [Candidatus Parcubacteria bacterium]|jgi:aspartyl-tRNA(Asn)/glutamyl-tRNA(Gln) amidotransferase subunit C